MQVRDKKGPTDDALSRAATSVCHCLLTQPRETVKRPNMRCCRAARTVVAGVPGRAPGDVVGGEVARGVVVVALATRRALQRRQQRRVRRRHELVQDLLLAVAPATTAGGRHRQRRVLQAALLLH